VGDALCIGGAPGSGKTTVATRLARRHGLRLYCADTRTWDHLDRAIASGVAAAARWEAMDPEERWEHASPEEMLEMTFLDERGSMVRADLDGLPASPLVVAEGVAVPADAAPVALWLVPTAEFQDARLRDAGVSPGQRTLYRLLREVKAREAAEHGVPVLTIDGSLGIDEVVGLVEARFADALAAGPRASGPAERAALLREANLEVVAQVRGYFARPWARGDAETTGRAFGCECGDPACTAEVTATLARASRAPVRAPGHG